MLKLRTPQVMTAKYKMTTPMFLGNAFQEADDKQFQTSSFKGALRFWWRALEWAHCVEEARGQEAEALRLLHKREASLFGLAADKEASTQSRVILRALMTGAKKQVKTQPLPERLTSVSYLMGMGLAHFRNGLLREYIEGGELEVHVQLRPVPGVQAEEQNRLEKTVANALILLGLLGGLGSRARKGFGSLAIQSLRVDGGEELAPQSLEEFRQFLQALKLDVPADKVPLSALTRRSRVMVAASAGDPLKALAKVNHEMQMYRSFGKDGKVGQQQAERRFVDDHDLARKAAHGEKINAIPRRSVFGLPHNYHFSSGGDVEIAPKETARRSSPLFIHVHQFPGNREACVIQSLLPAMFLPSNTPIEMKPKQGRAQQVPFTAVDWQVIHTYMDRFINKHQGQNLLTPKA